MIPNTPISEHPIPKSGRIGSIVSPVSGTVAAKGTSCSIRVVVSFFGFVGALTWLNGTSSSSSSTSVGLFGTSSSRITRGVGVGVPVTVGGVFVGGVFVGGVVTGADGVGVADSTGDDGVGLAVPLDGVGLAVVPDGVGDGVSSSFGVGVGVGVSFGTRW